MARSIAQKRHDKQRPSRKDLPTEKQDHLRRLERDRQRLCRSRKRARAAEAAAKGQNVYRPKKSFVPSDRFKRKIDWQCHQLSIEPPPPSRSICHRPYVPERYWHDPDLIRGYRMVWAYQAAGPAWFPPPRDTKYIRVSKKSFVHPHPKADRQGKDPPKKGVIPALGVGLQPRGASPSPSAFPNQGKAGRADGESVGIDWPVPNRNVRPSNALPPERNGSFPGRTGADRGYEGGRVPPGEADRPLLRRDPGPAESGNRLAQARDWAHSVLERVRRQCEAEDAAERARPYPPSPA